MNKECGFILLLHYFPPFPECLRPTVHRCDDGVSHPKKGKRAPHIPSLAASHMTSATAVYGRAFVRLRDLPPSLRTGGTAGASGNVAGEAFHPPAQTAFQSSVTSSRQGRRSTSGSSRAWSTSGGARPRKGRRRTSNAGRQPDREGDEAEAAALLASTSDAGHWVMVRGRRTFVLDGKCLRGRVAYQTWKKSQEREASGTTPRSNGEGAAVRAGKGRRVATTTGRCRRRQRAVGTSSMPGAGESALGRQTPLPAAKRSSRQNGATTRSRSGKGKKDGDSRSFLLAVDEEPSEDSTPGSSMDSFLVNDSDADSSKRTSTTESTPFGTCRSSLTSMSRAGVSLTPATPVVLSIASTDAGRRQVDRAADCSPMPKAVPPNTGGDGSAAGRQRRIIPKHKHRAVRRTCGSGDTTDSSDATASSYATSSSASTSDSGADDSSGEWEEDGDGGDDDDEVAFQRDIQRALRESSGDLAMRRCPPPMAIAPPKATIRPRIVVDVDVDVNDDEEEVNDDPLPPSESRAMVGSAASLPTAIEARHSHQGAKDDPQMRGRLPVGGWGAVLRACGDRVTPPTEPQPPLGCKRQREVAATVARVGSGDATLNGGFTVTVADELEEGGEPPPPSLPRDSREHSGGGRTTGEPAAPTAQPRPVMAPPPRRARLMDTPAAAGQHPPPWLDTVGGGSSVEVSIGQRLKDPPRPSEASQGSHTDIQALLRSASLPRIPSPRGPPPAPGSALARRSSSSHCRNSGEPLTAPAGSGGRGAISFLVTNGTSAARFGVGPGSSGQNVCAAGAGGFGATTETPRWRAEEGGIPAATNRFAVVETDDWFDADETPLDGV